MPKTLVTGNGSLLVNFEENLLMSDFYFPHVGMEDHTTFHHVHRIGLKIEDHFSWLNDGTWKFTYKYHEDSLVGKSTAINHALEIELLFEDMVDTKKNILLRRITLKNLSDRERSLKIFFNNDFHIYGDKMQDTAEYEPELNGILHYRKKRYFLISGQWERSQEGISEFATGKSEYGDREGTWRDAEDGKLGGNPIEQGSVDSTVGFKTTLAPQEEQVLNFWICAALNFDEIIELNDYVLTEKPIKIYTHTLDYWNNWANKRSTDFGDIQPEMVQMYKRSLLIMKSQIDKGGAIIAANDSDIIKFNKDTYTYMWSRDASIVAMAMSQGHYGDTSKNYFRFCSKIISKEGYMMHKFNPDGSLGSSWHPKFKNGEVQIPIQEDETALPLVAMWEHYKIFANLEFIYELYEPFIQKAGMFLANFMDRLTNLPFPSYDPWEEQRGIFTYTAACTYGGLMAAANLAHATANYDDQFVFTKKAQLLRKAILKYLYCEESQRFLKKIIISEDTIVQKDNTVDASLSFIWMMNVLPPDDPRVVNTMQAIKKHLWVPTEIGGIARYENDYYQREFDSNSHMEITGNPWIITTLWYADWLIETAQKKEDLLEVDKLLHWVIARANATGILPEQCDPLSGKPLSVAPLTWSHAEFVLAITRYRKKMKDLGMTKESTLGEEMEK